MRAFERAIAPLPGIERRKMFGCPAIFLRGHMVAGLVRDTMVIRLGDADIARFLARPGAKPFIAMGGRRMKHWGVVPRAMLASRATLRAWLRKAVAHVRSLPPKR